MPEQDAGPTLTNMTYFGRQAVKFGTVALVALIVGRMFFNAFTAYWIATHPPAPPPPTVGFGLLPPLFFPVQDEEDKPTQYKLETPTGRLPEFGDRAKVFFMPQPTASLLDDDNALQIASDLGYIFTPEKLSISEYRFTKSLPVAATLDLNSVTRTFSITSDYLSRPELTINPELPGEQEAVSIVKNYLSSADLLPADMATISGQVIYLKSLGNELEPALSFSDADFVQVDIDRTPIDGVFESYSPEGEKGTVHAILSGDDRGQNSVVAFDFNYQTVDYSQVETYPIRTTQDAWRLLQAGEGYIAEKGEQETAIIREVVLGYYDAFETQEYLQPIYVFKGDTGFLGYVPAVDPIAIQRETVDQ